MVNCYAGYSYNQLKVELQSTSATYTYMAVGIFTDWELSRRHSYIVNMHAMDTNWDQIKPTPNAINCVFPGVWRRLDDPDVEARTCRLLSGARRHNVSWPEQDRIE